MTVAELIVKLSRQNPNAEVVMSSDSEGNSFRKLTDITEGSVWQPSTQTPHVEFGDRPEHEVMDGGSKAVCLWPGY
jgi:hypothetical protein